MTQTVKMIKIPKINPITHGTVVVAFGKKSMAAVEVANRSSGVELVRFAVRPFSAEGINAAWLKTVWHQEHFSQHRIIYCAPASAVEYKTLIMPNLPLAQLEEAVKIEIESAGHSAKIIKIVEVKNQGRMLLVTAILVESGLLAQKIQLLKQAGLEVAWSGLRSQGIQGFINFNRGFFEESSKGTTYLDFDDQQTELGIIQNDRLVYRRGLAFGASDLSGESEPNMISDFLDDFRLTLAAYQADTKLQVPHKLLAFGAIEMIRVIGKGMAQELELHLYAPDKTKLTGTSTLQYTPGLAPLIGLALADAGLLPKEVLHFYTSEQDISKANRGKLMLAGWLSMIVILLLSGVMLGLHAGSIREQQTGKWLANKTAFLTNLRRIELQTSRDMRQIKQLNDWLDKQNEELEFLLLLKNNLPDGTQISDLTIENGIVKDLTGVTPSASLLLKELEKVPGLSNLKLKGTISTTLAGEVFQLEGMIPHKEQAK